MQGATNWQREQEGWEIAGEPGGNRTHDQWLKRPLLYR